MAGEDNPLDGVPCRNCGAASLRVAWRLTASPMGTWSLAGAQMKTSAVSWPWCICDACGAECRGKPEYE